MLFAISYQLARCDNIHKVGNETRVYCTKYLKSFDTIEHDILSP